MREHFRFLHMSILFCFCSTVRKRGTNLTLWRRMPGVFVRTLLHVPKESSVALATSWIVWRWSFSIVWRILFTFCTEVDVTGRPDRFSFSAGSWPDLNFANHYWSRQPDSLFCPPKACFNILWVSVAVFSKTITKFYKFFAPSKNPSLDALHFHNWQGAISYFLQLRLSVFCFKKAE